MVLSSHPPRRGAPAAGAFLSPMRLPYGSPMRGRPLMRIVAALAVVALLLAGFASTSVVLADAPCTMAMGSTDGAGDHGQPSVPKHTKQAPASLMCFAKCPAALLDRPGAPARLIFAKVHLLPSRQLALAGIGVDPPLHPPRA